MSSYKNQGGLWDNQRKFEKTDPDFNGYINIEGKVYEMVAWMSTSQHPKAPTINIKLTLPVKFQGTASLVVKEKDDDVPF